MKTTAYFWFTGLSGSGKTTVANGVKRKLEECGYSVNIVDGDDVRERFHAHLGFCEKDIKENNALIADICKEQGGAYDAVLVPIISPFAMSRRCARACLGERFYEIYFKADLDYVVQQDTKGLYAKARKNIIKDLIGFSPDGVPYEAPAHPDFIIDAQNEEPDDSIKKFFDFVLSKLNNKVRVNK